MNLRSRARKRQRTLGAPLMVTALGIPACFAVEKVDPGSPDGGGHCESLLIDDFEDGNPFPSSSQLGRWACYTFNPEFGPDAGQDVSCDLEPGFDSRFELYLAFTVRDSPDGVQNFPGAGLISLAALPFDVTRYSELVFSAKVDSGAAALPIDSIFEPIFHCTSATGNEGPFPTVDPPNVRRSATLTNQWQTFHLELASFAQPSYQTNHIQGGTQRCLGLVDSIQFQISTNLMDGREASGRLHVDDIHLDNAACLP